MHLWLTSTASRAVHLSAAGPSTAGTAIHTSAGMKAGVQDGGLLNGEHHHAKCNVHDAVQELGADFDVGEIPEDMKADAEEWHEKLVEKAIEVDDAAMEAFFEGEVGVEPSAPSPGRASQGSGLPNNWHEKPVEKGTAYHECLGHLSSML